MPLTATSDSELLVQFRNPVTKEKAFTAIIKKYQEKLYWHVKEKHRGHTIGITPAKNASLPFCNCNNSEKQNEVNA